MTLRSPLGRVQTQPPISDLELHAMRQAAWRQQGVAMIVVADITDAWLRQAITNEANRLYGRGREVLR